MLLASLLSHGVHTPYSLINGSQTYYLLSSATSRSPNQYLKWMKNNWVEWEDCRRSCEFRPYVLRSTQDEVSKEARWFIVPEPECDDGLESTPCYYHIFGGKDSVQPAMMINVDWAGEIYPRPYYRGDEHWLANEMAWARFRIEPVSHESEQPNADELYHIITGPESGKPDEMIFLQSPAWGVKGSSLDTWTLDRNDHQATWRIVPASCAEAADCELPDLEAIFQAYEPPINYRTVLIVCLSVLTPFCCCVCLLFCRGYFEYPGGRNYPDDTLQNTSTQPPECERVLDCINCCNKNCWVPCFGVLVWFGVIWSCGVNRMSIETGLSIETKVNDQPEALATAVRETLAEAAASGAEMTARNVRHAVEKKLGLPQDGLLDRKEELMGIISHATGKSSWA